MKDHMTISLIRKAQTAVKHRWLPFLLAVTLLLTCLTPGLAYAAEKEIAVGSWTQLLALATSGEDYSGKTVRLTANITAPSNAEWPGITGFAGTFDGNGKTISGLAVNDGTTTGTGLFNTTAAGAKIQNLTIAKSTFAGESRVGALVGKAAGALSVENVRVADSVTVSAKARLGGMIGSAEADVTVTNCWSAAAVSAVDWNGDANGYAGGMVGWVTQGTMSHLLGCLYSGAMSRQHGNYFGGMVGHVHGDSGNNGTVKVQSCVALPNMTGLSGQIGGFVGGSLGSDYVDIYLINSYSGSAAVVGSSVTERISDTDKGYWTPATTVGGATRHIAFAAQLIGYALASKGHGFGGRTLKLNNDLNLAGWGDWPMLGKYGRPFAGIFDGANHTVSGLHVSISSGNVDAANCFAGFVSDMVGGAVQNLTIADSTFISDTNFVGAAAARISGAATVSGVHVTDSVRVSGHNQVGGVVGKIGAEGGTVEQCWSEADVQLCMTSTKQRAAGGVVGAAQDRDTYVRNCLFTGTVDAQDGAAGGILGSTNDKGCYATVQYCVSAGILTGTYVGGILGDFVYIYRQDWEGETYPQTYAISNCYAAPVNKAVGSLNVEFTDTFISNTTTHSSISSLYGNTCDGLDSNIWHFRANDVPKLQAFYSDSLPCTANSTIAPESRLAQMTIREAFADVPVPASTSTVVEGYTALGCYYRKYTYAGSGNPLSAYLVRLVSAGFTLYSGNATTPITARNWIYGAVLTDGERYLIVTYYDRDADDHIYVAVVPKSADQIEDGASLFSDVPTVGEQNPSAFDYGDNNFVKTYTGVTYGSYTALCSSLVSNGFTRVADNGSGLYGKVFTASYIKDTRTVTVTFNTGRSELYVSVGADMALSPHLDSTQNWAADATKYDSTVLVMPKLENGNANSFVFRLKNGHFIINDGGYTSDAERLITLLEQMTPGGQKPVVEGWFISHGHSDHAGALLALSRNPLLRDRIRVDGIYYSEPPITSYMVDPSTVGISRAVVKSASMLRTAAGGVTQLYRNHMGERYYFCDVSVDILFTQEQIPLSSYESDCNETTTWITVHADGDTVLLAGDGSEGGRKRIVGSAGSSYTNDDMTFTMRSLLHHGYNENNIFTNATTTTVLLMTCLAECDSLTDKNKSACDYARNQVSEEIFPDADRWITFPYTVETAQAGTDISVYRSGDEYTAPDAPSGKVFAGWYWDSALSIPVGTEDTTGVAFPRFADADVLTVRYQQDQTQYSEGNRQLRIVTTVDRLDYQKVGFKLTYYNSKGVLKENVPANTTKVYAELKGYSYKNGVGQEIKYTPGGLDENNQQLFSDESIRFCAFKLNASAGIVASNRAGISAIPYWITADGTEVLGTRRDGLQFIRTGLQDGTGQEEEIPLED